MTKENEFDLIQKAWEQFKSELLKIHEQAIAWLDRQDDGTVGFIYAVVEGQRGYERGLKLIDDREKYDEGFAWGKRFGSKLRELVLPWLIKYAFIGVTSKSK